jgi:hypothetical protein
MRSQTLDYSLTPRRDMRRFIVRSLAAASLFVACGWLLITVFHWHYYAERERVRIVLEAAAPAGQVQLGGFDDGGFEWELVEALVSVDGSPTKTILLSGPRAQDLRSGKHINVDCIDVYSFALVTPENYWLSRIDFGKDSVFADILPFKLQNVQDLVSHYDDFVAFLRALPPTGQFNHKDGKSYAYEIKDHPNAPGKLVIVIREPSAAP